MNYQDCPKCNIGLVKTVTEYGYTAYSCFMCGYVEYDPPGEDFPYTGKCEFCGAEIKLQDKGRPRQYCDEHTSGRDRRPHRKYKTNNVYNRKNHPWRTKKKYDTK